jgi:hypothetical protein
MDAPAASTAILISDSDPGGPMTQGRLLLIVRPQQADAFDAPWPRGVQIIVDRRQGERRINRNPRVAIQQRRVQRRQRRWVDQGLDVQGVVLVRA